MESLIMLKARHLIEDLVSETQQYSIAVWSDSKAHTQPEKLERMREAKQEMLRFIEDLEKFFINESPQDRPVSIRARELWFPES